MIRLSEKQGMGNTFA